MKINRISRDNEYIFTLDNSVGVFSRSLGLYTLNWLSCEHFFNGIGRMSAFDRRPRGVCGISVDEVQNRD